MYPGWEVISIELNDGELVVTKRQRSNVRLLCNPPKPAPDRIVRETYGAVDGRVELTGQVEGQHIPASTVPEQFNFD